MPTSYGALCTDFYVNQKLALKLDLPGERETILHLFDRIRRSEPAMERFRRFDDELALESSRREAEYKWLALRRTSIRTGHVNPQSMEQAYRFHRLVLEVCPFHLTISPLDVDYLELLFGFDLECAGNHDEVVYDALMGQSPLGKLLRLPQAFRGVEGAKIIDVQPVFGMQLSPGGELQAFFEVKTRQRGRRGNARRYRNEPISIFLTIRRYGPISDIKDLGQDFNQLKDCAELLATERLVPDLLTPIARHITSGSA